MLYFLSQIDEGLAAEVAYYIGMHVPKGLATPLNQIVPADADRENIQSVVKEGSLDKSAALSMANSPTILYKQEKLRSWPPMA